jgi:starvation-inducible DNA-binding protein
MSIGLEQFAVTEISPAEMLAELLDNNEQLVSRMREIYDLCDKYGDVATASLLEVWIDEAERQARFLFETGRSAW